MSWNVGSVKLIATQNLLRLCQLTVPSRYRSCCVIEDFVTFWCTFACLVGFAMEFQYVWVRNSFIYQYGADNMWYNMALNFGSVSIYRKKSRIFKNLQIYTVEEERRTFDSWADGKLNLEIPICVRNHQNRLYSSVARMNTTFYPEKKNLCLYNEKAKDDTGCNTANEHVNNHGSLLSHSSF